MRKSPANSRVRPRRSSRPATRPSKPAWRGAWIRASTCSTTCTAAVRPNRAISARGIASVFLIVPVAEPSARYAPEAFMSTRLSVSEPSSCESSSTATVTVFAVSPAAKVSIPDATV